MNNLTPNHIRYNKHPKKMASKGKGGQAYQRHESRHLIPKQPHDIKKWISNEYQPDSYSSKSLNHQLLT